jgi:hypothetical protein
MADMMWAVATPVRATYPVAGDLTIDLEDTAGIWMIHHW